MPDSTSLSASPDEDPPQRPASISHSSITLAVGSVMAFSPTHNISLALLRRQSLVPLVPSNTPLKGPWTMNITEDLASGWLWDVYFGLLQQGKYNMPVVAKLCRLDTYTDDELVRAVQGMRTEYKLLNSSLADLQGAAVPRFFGLYTVKDTGLRVAILEFCGDSIVPDDEDFALRDASPATKREIHTLVDKLHSRSVVHNDLSPRHILRRQGPRDIMDYPLAWPDNLEPLARPGSLCLVDFDHALFPATKADIMSETAQLERLLRPWDSI